MKNLLNQIDATKTDLPSVIKQCLEMTEIYLSIAWVEVIRVGLLKLLPQEASTVIFVIELSIQRRTSLCTYILKTLKNLEPLTSNSENRFRYIDFILLSLISTIEFYKEEVSHTRIHFY